MVYHIVENVLCCCLAYWNQEMCLKSDLKGFLKTQWLLLITRGAVIHSLPQVNRPVGSSGVSIYCFPVSLESHDSWFFFFIYPGFYLPVHCVAYLYSSAAGTGSSSATSS